MRESVSNEAWLARTRQTWKLYVGLVLVLATGVQLVLLFWAIQTMPMTDAPPTSVEVLLMLGPPATGLAAIAWIGAGIRCRTCGRKIGWYVLAHRPSSTWIAELVGASRCPVCGHDGRELRP